MSFRTVPVKAVATLNPETLSEDTDSDRIFSYAEISDVSVGQPVRWQEPSPFGSLPSRARRVVRDGDVIISTVRTYLRAVAHVVDAPATAVVSTGFAVFRPARIDARFLGYALEETHFVDRVVAASVGVSYPAVNASDIARLPISAPSPDIQRQIADYLDHETAEIDAFIADLGIARAFSQEGLVVQRDRIFGDYAAAASVAELRGKISESDERASATASSADLLTVSIASGVTPRGEWTADQHRADDLTKYKVVRVGDIVLNRMRAFQGAVGVSRNNGITSPDYAVLRCDRRTLLPEFAANLLKSPRFVYEITRRLRGIGNEESGQVRTPRVAVADLIRIPTKVPELEVQQRAVDQWAAEQRLASEVSRDFDAAITLAKERRAALITAAVTGQIDVTTTQTPAVDDIQTAIEESR